MKAIDLTHNICENMPMFPGSSSPSLHISSDYEKDGFRETLLTFLSHTGTHADAPAHMLKSGKTLEEFPVTQFIGKALVIDCRLLEEGQFIGFDGIEPVEEKAKNADFLLFNTGWDKRWESRDLYGNFPLLDCRVIEFIERHRFKGIGFDLMSPDKIEDAFCPIHKRLLRQENFIIIENLCNLELCGSDLFNFVCLPLKFAHSDGAPVRAVAWWEED